MSFSHLTTAVIMTALIVDAAIYHTAVQASPRSTQIAEIFLENLERKNTAGLEQLLADRVVFEAFGTRVQGRKAVLEQLTAALEFFDQLDFSNERIGMGQDSQTVLVEAQGRYRLKQNGASLQNGFALILQLEQDNQISLIQAQVTPFISNEESNTFTPNFRP